jgi:hypothetical protein
MRIVAAAIGLSIALSGCSLFSARSPDPRRARGEMPVCNPGRGAAGLDGTMAALLGVAALAGFAAEEADVGVGFGLTSLAYAGSSYHGFKSARRCREALALHQAELDRVLERDEEIAEAPLPATTPAASPPRVPTPAEAAAVAAEADTDADADTDTEPAPEPDAAWPDFWVEVNP